MSILEAWVDECTAKAPVLSEFGGTVPSEDMVRAWTTRHYAEVRTFIDIKLPERMRICPHDAYVAKKFFWHIYEEEQGDFVAGGNHAQMFAKFAHALGIPQDELDEEFERYSSQYEYMKTIQPSIEALVIELAISYAWESAINRVAKTLTATLGDVVERHGLAEESTQYFTAHIVLDEDHAKEALETLEYYVTTPELEELAKKAIHETLVERSPWALSVG